MLHGISLLFLIGTTVKYLLVKFSCPTWLWTHLPEDFLSDCFDEADPDKSIYNDDCQEIKDASVEENLLPEFMDRVQETHKSPLKNLGRLAPSGVHSNESHDRIIFDSGVCPLLHSLVTKTGMSPP
jgi:hypothetical protein